jgi:hypothetical protein
MVEKDRTHVCTIQTVQAVHPHRSLLSFDYLPSLYTRPLEAFQSFSNASRPTDLLAYALDATRLDGVVEIEVRHRD